MDSVEDEFSFVSHGHHISSSRESIKVSNISMLKFNNPPSNQSVVDDKMSPSNATHNDNVDITEKTNTILPDNCQDNGINSQCKSDKSTSEDESTDKTKSPAAGCIASDTDMKIIAAGCYEHVIDLLENWDEWDHPPIDDNQPHERDKVLHYLDIEPVNPVSDLPVSDSRYVNNSDEDMQCLAMVCYETVTDMIRNGDVCSEFKSKYMDKPVYYLEVEPLVENNDELPVSTYPPSTNTNDTNQYLHQEEKYSPKGLPYNGFEPASQQAHSQPLVTSENIASQCCMNVDSLVPSNEQVGIDGWVEPELEAVKNGDPVTVSTLKVDDCDSKKSMNEEPSSSDHLCKYAYCILPVGSHGFNSCCILKYWKP